MESSKFSATRVRRQWIRIGLEGGGNREPVRIAEMISRGLEQPFLCAHVPAKERGICGQRQAHVVKPVRRATLIADDGALDTCNEISALHMFGLQAIELAVESGRSCTQTSEYVLVFLGMVHAFREVVDVINGAANQPEIRLALEGRDITDEPLQ